MVEGDGLARGIQAQELGDPVGGLLQGLGTIDSERPSASPRHLLGDPFGEAIVARHPLAISTVGIVTVSEELAHPGTRWG